MASVYALDTFHLCLLAIDPYYRLVSHYGERSFLDAKSSPVMALEVSVLLLCLLFLSLDLMISLLQYQYILIGVGSNWALS